MKKIIKQRGLFTFITLIYAGLAAATNDAELMMQIIPDEVPTGKTFNVVMQFKNTGQTTWYGEDYYLSSKHSQHWESTLIELKPGTKTRPGEVATFKFDLTAPLTPGEHTLQWQLRKGETVIGKTTAAVKIRITGNLIPRNNSEFVYQKVPLEMVAGETYNVTLQYKNTGETAWVSGQYALTTPTAVDSLTWAIDRAELNPGSVTRAGDFHSFSFKIRAPADPGVYRFQWQLTQNQSGLFGSLSKPLEINVQPNQ